MSVAKVKEKRQMREILLKVRRFMKKVHSVKTSDYLSYGIDNNENERLYYYLQTAHNNEEDIELITSQYETIVFLIGKILCGLFGKKLARW